MNRNFLIIGLFFIAGLVFSQTLQLDSETVDIGNVKKGQTAHTNVTITNTGKAPLILTNVKPSCGCTVPTWPKTPIMPGKSTQIKIEYEGENVGAVNKVIEIFSNDATAPRKIVRIKGKVY